MSRGPLAAAVLAGLTFLAFANSFDAAISLDSATVVLKDPRVREATAANVGLIFHHTYYWPNGEAGLYRPLTTLTYLFNYAILGNADRPEGYHWINFLLHVVNVLLVYALASRLTRRSWPAVFLAALWAVHPVQTEAVTNIAGRADLLAGLGILGAFLAYLKSTESPWWLAGVAAFTCVGAFSKESAVVVPGVIVIYEAALGRKWRSLVYGCLAALAPIAVMLYARSAVLAASAPAELPFVDNPLISARLTALKVCARYLGLIVWPATLSADYSFNSIPLSRGSFPDWIAWLALAAFLAAVVWSYRRSRAAFFFGCFAILTLLPMANLVFLTGSIMAERFLYLPSIGLLGCAVIVVYALSQRPWIAPAVLCLATVAFAVRTVARNTDWRDEASIVAAGVQANPASFKLHARLAELLFQDRNLDGAIAEVEKSLAILDPLPDALNLSDPYRAAGGYYLLTGRDDRRAVEILRRATNIEKSQRSAAAPGADRSVPYQLLAAAYLRIGDENQAAETAAEALALHPQSADAYRQIAATLPSQSALALIEGALITSDEDLLKGVAPSDLAKYFCTALAEAVKARPGRAEELSRRYGALCGAPQKTLPATR